MQPTGLILPCRRQLPDFLPRGYFRRLDGPLDASLLWSVPGMLRPRRNVAHLVQLLVFAVTLSVANADSIANTSIANTDSVEDADRLRSRWHGESFGR